MIDLGNDFESIPTRHAGEFTTLPAGGYVCITKNAVASMNKKNVPMLTLDIDICEGEYKGFFKNAQYPPKLFQNIRDKDSKISPFFKGLLKDFEESNAGLNIKGGMFDERQLVNKFIGVIFGEEEREYNGKIIIDTKPQRTTNVNKIRSGDYKIPEKKRLEKPPSASNSLDEFGGVDIPDENLPF